MKFQVPITKPWSLQGKELAADVRWELRHQLTSLSVLSQWLILPVIFLTVSGLWTELQHSVTLTWAAVALIQSALGYLNNQMNAKHLDYPRSDDYFLIRNSLHYMFFGLIWGALPLCAALWGSERATWFALIINMAIMTALVLVLSTSHKIFFAALSPTGLLVICSLVIGPAYSIQLLSLGLIYLLALVMMHNTLFQVHVDRVQSSLRNAAHATALANTLQHHDALTGLYNQAGLNQWLSLFPSEEATFKKVTIAVANVVGFSEINLLHGASVGDTLLLEIASRLIQKSGDKFGIARLGGAQFLLVDARHNAEPEELAQLLTELEHEDYLIADRLVNISFQQSSIQGKAEDIEALIETIRSREQLRSPEPHKSESERQRDLLQRRELIMNFHEALIGEQISPWFQPILCCADNTILGWEALARWVHPTQGLVLPEEFLDIARISGQATQLTRTMFQASALFVQHLDQQGSQSSSKVSINFTASDLASPSTMDWVLSTLKTHELKPHQIIVEISEKEALMQEKQFRTNLQQIETAGIPIAIDDFGTGYANISHLLDLPASTVKLDKRFVDKLPHDKHSIALVRAIITMASSMDMYTIAEGVEREEQLVFLRENGCSAYQGFLGGPALPEDDALAFAKRWQSGVHQPDKEADTKYSTQ